MKEKNHGQLPVVIGWPLTKSNLNTLLSMIGSTKEKSTIAPKEHYPVCRGCGESIGHGEPTINIAGVVSHDKPSCVHGWFQR
ncbi:MAG: hypothetical protein V4449_00240 [Patescibacteria group bacterium]